MVEVPVKVYRTADRLTVAAPMPGVLAEDFTVEVAPDNRLLLHAETRGATAESQIYQRFAFDDGSGMADKQVIEERRERLMDEWSAGPYDRALALPVPVDGAHATATYGNGVLVVVLPVAERVTPTRLHLQPLGMSHAERVGSAGYPVRPLSDSTHRAAKEHEQAQRGGGKDPHDRRASEPRSGTVAPTRG